MAGLSPLATMIGLLVLEAEAVVAIWLGFTAAIAGTVFGWLRAPGRSARLARGAARLLRVGGEDDGTGHGRSVRAPVRHAADRARAQIRALDLHARREQWKRALLGAARLAFKE